MCVCVCIHAYYLYAIEIDPAVWCTDMRAYVPIERYTYVLCRHSVSAQQLNAHNLTYKRECLVDSNSNIGAHCRWLLFRPVGLSRVRVCVCVKVAVYILRAKPAIVIGSRRAYVHAPALGIM